MLLSPDYIHHKARVWYLLKRRSFLWQTMLSTHIGWYRWATWRHYSQAARSHEMQIVSLRSVISVMIGLDSNEQVRSCDAFLYSPQEASWGTREIKLNKGFHYWKALFKSHILFQCFANIVVFCSQWAQDASLCCSELLKASVSCAAIDLLSCTGMYRLSVPWLVLTLRDSVERSD